MKKLSIVLLFLALCIGVHAQLLPVPRYQPLDSNGKTLPSGKIFTFTTGTTTPLATFTDAALSVPNTNPIILSASGYAPQPIFLSAATYRIVLQTSAGVQIWSVDGVNDFGQVLKINTIVGNPAANASQSISGPINLGIFNLQAGFFLSSTATPSAAGVIRLATGDTINWENAALNGNNALSDDGIAATANGNLADVLEWDGGGYQAGAFVDTSAAPAQSGVLRAGNNVNSVVHRNAAGNGDIAAVAVDNTNVTLLGGTAGVKTAGPINANSQNIKNAILSGAANGNTVQLQDVQGPGAAIVGTAADVALFTGLTPIAANVIAAAKGLRVTVITQHMAGTASVNYKLKFGAGLLDNFSIAPFSNALFDGHIYEIYNNVGVQNTQYWVRTSNENLVGNAANVPAYSNGVGAIDFTLSQALSFTFNVAATDQVKPIFWKVELIY